MPVLISPAAAQDSLSLVAPSQSYASDPRLIEIILLSALAAAIALVIAGVLIRVGEMLIESRGRLPRLISQAQNRARLAGRLVARRKERMAKLAEHAEEIKLTAKRRADLVRKLNELNRAEDEVVHLIGEETDASSCFLALVSNRYVETAVQAEQEHGFLHSSWAKPQMIEVWATNMGEARAALERTFPAMFGFSLARLTPAIMRESVADSNTGSSSAA